VRFHWLLLRSRKGGGERRGVGRAQLDEGGIKEVWMVLHFLYRGAREGAPWRRAAPAKLKAARATEVGEDPRVGQLGPEAGGA
jgi:hypothetical protein